MSQPGDDVSSRERRLGDLLQASGRLDAADLDRALRHARTGGQLLHVVLARLGLVSETDLAGALATLSALPLVGRDDYPLAPVLEASELSVKFLRQNRLIPLAMRDEGLVVAVADPFDSYVLEALEVKFGQPVLPRVGIPADIEAALEAAYAQDAGSLEAILDELGDGDADAEEDVERLRDQAREVPVVRVVDHLIQKAVEARASDIHIEPFEGRLRVRYRIDGVLREVEAPPARFRNPIVSRIKLIARLDIAERRLPQDGRLRRAIRGRDIDFRVATMPTMHGEAVVLRILDRDRLSLDFTSLGFSAASERLFRDALDRPNGIVLVTGPTGSGKTSTLYTALLALNSPERKIVTVEDPIEYELPGINQIQTRPQIGLTFANVLRSTLRHDPDIVMIGEVRDLETAEISVQAALTGHLVLSTVHTNSAAGTVARLLDMGVEPYLLTSTLNGIVAQRLVRRLCPDCREAYDPLPELVAGLGLGDIACLYRARGCAACQRRGYLGRVALVEVLPVTDAVRRLILGRDEAGAIEAAARAGGMRSMYQDGLDKAVAGLTTIDEVMRVTRET
jgi:general secretion pathway protein E